MQIASILPLLMMSIALYVGLYSLLFYLRVRTETSNLFFSASCFSVAAYDFFCSRVYSLHSVTGSGLLMKGQFISLLFIALFMLLYIKNIVNMKEKSELRVIEVFISAVSVFLFVIILNEPFFNESMPHITHIPFLNITYTEAKADPVEIMYSLYLLFFIIMIWSSYAITRNYRMGLKYLKPILIAMVIFYITAINDVLVGMGIISNLYLLEYGFTLFVIGTAVSLQGKYLEMYKKIENMNKTLDEQVKLRTGELVEARDCLEVANSEYRVLLQVLSHDLTNNLSSIISSIEMIEDHDAAFDDLKDVLSLSAKNALNLIEIVRNIRAIDDKKIELKNVNLLEAVTESLAIMNNRIASKNIVLNINIDNSLSVIVEKVSFINSVMNNILSNAIKFSPPGSRIFISAANCTKQKDNGRNIKEIELSFRDQGIGIPEEELKNIFQLSRTKSRLGTEGETGVGYGMPLVNRFISLYDGKIKVDSIEKTGHSTDHGTTVTMILNSGK